MDQIEMKDFLKRNNTFPDEVVNPFARLIYMNAVILTALSVALPGEANNV